jgi:serine/threonine-protein kinase ULK/ATG1
MQSNKIREEDKSNFKDRRREGENTSSTTGRERIGNYVIGKEIGRGSFATVYKGYRSVS